MRYHFCKFKTFLHFFLHIRSLCSLPHFDDPSAQEYVEKSKMRGAVVIEGGPSNLDKAALAFKVISSFQLV